MEVKRQVDELNVGLRTGCIDLFAKETSHEIGWDLLMEKKMVLRHVCLHV